MHYRRLLKTLPRPRAVGEYRVIFCYEADKSKPPLYYYVVQILDESLEGEECGQFQTLAEALEFIQKEDAAVNTQKTG